MINSFDHSFGAMRQEAERILLTVKRDHRRHIGKHGFTQAKADRQMSLLVSIVLVLRELEKSEILL